MQNIFTTPNRSPHSGQLRPSVLKGTPVARLTSEARDSMKKGLPLPQNPYEYVDVSVKKEAVDVNEKQEAASILKGTKTGKSSLVAHPIDASVTSSQKKSVRWANVLDKNHNGSGANRELVFTAEVIFHNISAKVTPICLYNIY